MTDRRALERISAGLHRAGITQRALDRLKAACSRLTDTRVDGAAACIAIAAVVAAGRLTPSALVIALDLADEGDRDLLETLIEEAERAVFQ